MSDDVHGVWKKPIATHVIAMRMGINDRDYRLIRHAPDAIEEHRAPTGQLRVNHRHASVHNEDPDITPAE